MQKIRSGAQGWKVDEPPRRTDAVLVAEFAVWPEPKSLIQELRELFSRYGGSYKAAEIIGVSAAFVRQNASETVWES